MNKPLADALLPAAEYLTFRLGADEYGVPISQVQELRVWEPVTRIPFAKAWEHGLLNVRGAVVPVVDLRLRIGLQEASYVQPAAIILFKLTSGSRERIHGAVVDELTGVAQVAAGQLQDVSHLAANQAVFACGCVACQGRLLIILDTKSIFSLAC